MQNSLNTKKTKDINDFIVEINYFIVSFHFSFLYIYTWWPLRLNVWFTRGHVKNLQKYYLQKTS